jgi:hypothetical protein
VPMVKLQRRPFGEPDDVREIPYGQLETYDMGEIRIGRSILRPGWRWSESIKPIAQTELCESHHVGLCVSGSARIRMRERAELAVEAGQFYEIPPGHDTFRGAAIHIAARIADLAGPGEVYASWATRELLAGSPISFTDRGLHELKGQSEGRRFYLVEPSA